MIEVIFSLEARKGHLKWSVEQVAKAAKVSRTLVYYHFGRSKLAILENCLELIAQEFYGLTEDRLQFSKQPLRESLRVTLNLYKENPSLALFYQRWRNTPSKFQDKIHQIESRYDQKLKDNFPRAKVAQRKALRGLFHGLVTAPYIDEESLDAALDLLNLENL